MCVKNPCARVGQVGVTEQLVGEGKQLNCRQAHSETDARTHDSEITQSQREPSDLPDEDAHESVAARGVQGLSGDRREAPEQE